MGDRYVEEVRAGGNASVREGRAPGEGRQEPLLIPSGNPYRSTIVVRAMRGFRSCEGLVLLMLASADAVSPPPSHACGRWPTIFVLLSLIHISEPTRPY